MEKLLIDYLEHTQSKIDALSDDAGPVITISRECGCFSHNIAIKPVKILYREKRSHEWK